MQEVQAQITPIPQPPESWLLGNVKEIDGDLPIASFNRLCDLYGSIVKLNIVGRTVVLLSSQQMVNHVSDQSKFHKVPGRALKEVRAFAGDGLFTAYDEEPNWLLAHKILVPAFGPVAIRNMFPQMEDIATQMLFRWDHYTGQPFDVADQFTRLTLDTIALCAFDLRFNSFHTDSMHPFIEDMNYLLKASSDRTSYPEWSKKVFIFQEAEYQKRVASLHKLCDDIIAARKKKPGVGVNDLLTRMLEGKDPDTGAQLSDENIRYQLVTFLVAGHETTSGLLSFVTYYLLKNPSAYRKVREEVDAFGQVTQSNFHQFKYIDAVLKETLRLCPTAPAYSVQTRAAKEILPGGYQVEAGTNLVVVVPKLHRDPKVYEDPEVFKPERFLDGGFEALPPNSWKPFGNGQRACIGRGFAMQEAVIAIASIFKHFDLQMVDPAYELHIKQNLTIKPKDFQITVRPRRRGGTILTDLLKSVCLQRQGISAADPASSGGAKDAGKTPFKDGKNPITVLYGSNSGSCEAFASEICNEAKQKGFEPVIATLDHHASNGELPTSQPVIICAASYEGNPTDNAKHFVESLRAKDASKSPLKGVSYSVFGAGHHDWAGTFHKIPIYIDKRLEELGAERILPLATGDAGGDLVGAFEDYKELLWKNISSGQVTEPTSGANTNPEFLTTTQVSVDIIPASRNFSRVTSVGKVVRHEVLVEASELGPAKHHIEIQLPDGQTYRSGDYLSVFPKNPQPAVDRILKRFNMDSRTHVIINPAKWNEASHYPVGVPIRAEDILSGYVELAQPVSKRLLKVLASMCKDEGENRSIEVLEERYQEDVLDKRVSLIDLLEVYPSCDCSFSFYLENLSRLKVRQYSISSSPLHSADLATLTFDVLAAKSFSGLTVYLGAASNYLSSLKVGDELDCSVKSSSDFHLPDDIETPIVLFASGTGISPFRGFIQERALQKASGRKVGKVVLFYGCRNRSDFLHSDELEAWSRGEDAFLDLRVVFSRPGAGDDPGLEGERYVQHRVWRQREDIIRLYKEGAQFYTCGSAKRLSASLKSTLVDIVAENKGLDKERAALLLDEVAKERYRTDVFL
ncbi:cytochrome P450 family protein [Violaceomyces palustris]|uniref:Cytochrome P450 family protein n=1 Tax=Violaceomyces palustris TaxID=1673888 RepID=A0ACD0P470_9BASI|nr:cytochrome P450 family protein [Violaceomyces palustris]